MTYVVNAYLAPFATYGCSKDAKACAGVLTVPDWQELVLGDMNGFLTQQKHV